MLVKKPAKDLHTIANQIYIFKKGLNNFAL